jgi:hypothetical protein
VAEVAGPWGRVRAASWKTARRVAAKAEFQFGELFPRVGFMVTNLEPDSLQQRPADRGMRSDGESKIG